jgi:hypothetical protein
MTKLVVAECRRLCADVGFVVPLGVVVVVVVVVVAETDEEDEEEDSIESWEAASSSFLLLSLSSSTTSKITGGSCSRRRGGGGGGDVRRLDVDVEEGDVAAPADAARPAAEVAADAKRLRKGEGGAPPGAPPLAVDASRPELEDDDAETTESPRLFTTCNGGNAWPDDRALLPCGPLFISSLLRLRREALPITIFEKSNKSSNHSHRKNSSKNMLETKDVAGAWDVELHLDAFYQTVGHAFYEIVITRPSLVNHMLTSPL